MQDSVPTRVLHPLVALVFVVIVVIEIAKVRTAGLERAPLVADVDVGRGFDGVELEEGDQGVISEGLIDHSSGS